MQEAALELRKLIQQFEVGCPRVPEAQRDDYEKRIRKLRAELTRLESYDADIDDESPEEMAQQVLSVARRLRVYLPEERAVEALRLALPHHHAGQALLQVTWEGQRWILYPQRLAVHDVQILADYLSGQLCQTNDLDLWRASQWPDGTLLPGWRGLGASRVQLGEEA